MCSAMKFKPVPNQNAIPETKASNPAKLKTADAVRITIKLACGSSVMRSFEEIQREET